MNNNKSDASVAGDQPGTSSTVISTSKRGANVATASPSLEAAEDDVLLEDDHVAEHLLEDADSSHDGASSRAAPVAA